MEKPFECPERDRLQARLSTLLEDHAAKLHTLTLAHGVIEAEKRAQLDYDACVAARAALQEHETTHGCGLTSSTLIAAQS